MSCSWGYAPYMINQMNIRTQDIPFRIDDAYTHAQSTLKPTPFSLLLCTF